MKTLFTKSKLLAVFFFLLSAFPFSCVAQDLGDVGFRTVTQKVFFGQTTATVSPPNSPFPCTPTNGTPCVIPNLGQNVHAITYSISSPCSTGFFMDLRLEATQDGSTWFSISNDATDQNSGMIQGATVAGLTARGLYAGYRLNLVSFACAGGGTPAITANYSGTYASDVSSSDTFYQSSFYRKLIVQNQVTTAASGSNPVTISSNTGSSSGTLFVTCSIGGASGACPGGAQAMFITVTTYIAFGSSIGGGGAGNVFSSTTTYKIPNTVLPQVQVTGFPASSIVFGFTSSVGSAGTNWSVYFVPNPNPASPAVNDPCASSGTVKQSAQINLGAATTTQLVAPIAGQTVFPCGFSISVFGSATATATFTSGTGPTCALTQVVLTGSYEGGTIPIAYTSPPVPGSFANSPLGNGFCVVAGGATPVVQGIFTYIQQ